MKHIYLFFFLYYFSNIHTTSAQFTPADSLQLAFKKATTDTAKLSVLFKDTPFEYLGHSDIMLSLYQQGSDIAKRVNDKTSYMKSIYYPAMIYIYDKSDEGTGFQWLQKSLAVAEEQQNNFYIQRIYYAMSIVHHHQGNLPKMYDALYKSIEYNEKITNPEDGAFSALSQNLFQEGRYDEYLNINKRLVALLEKTNAPDINKLNAYNSIADALKKFPNKKQERDYYLKKVSALSDKIPDAEKYPDLNLIRASIYYKLNRVDEAIKCANQILSLKNDDDFTMSNKGLTHKFLADIYEEQKKYPLSIFHNNAFHEIEVQQMQKRLSEESGRKIIKAEAERNLLLKQKEVDKQKWVSILGFSIAFLVLLAGIVAYHFYKKEQEHKQELAAINATKDKLFSIIAHDLRTPIGTLKTYLEMTDFGLMSQAQFSTASQKLTNNVNALFQTLDNILHWAYSQLKGIKAKPENINLYDVASEELRFLYETAQQKNIAIVNNIPAETTIFADQNQIGLVIRNIVNNALKFTHPGGEIVLNCQNTVEERNPDGSGKGGKTNLTISDNGIGIPQDIQNQLFTINEKTSRRGTASEKGQGLGLILAKEMVEANKGTLHIESIDNKGTSINIQLPVSAFVH